MAQRLQFPQLPAFLRNFSQLTAIPATDGSFCNLRQSLQLTARLSTFEDLTRGRTIAFQGNRKNTFQGNRAIAFQGNHALLVLKEIVQLLLNENV